MSRPQDPPRSLFSFGNPFKTKLPKGSNSSPTFLTLLNSFEERLAQRTRKLRLNKEDVLSLSWMQLAMELLCKTHNDIKNFILDLEFPVSKWDDEWTGVYMDNTVKFLDICNAFSSQISRMNQGHILLQCGLQYLDSTSSTQLVRAHSSLDAWRRHINSKNPRIEKCCGILKNLFETLNLPNVRKSAKGNVLMRALYGVKVQTMFVCGVFVAAFTGSSEMLIDLHVPEMLLWAEAFSSLQTIVNGEIRNKLTGSVTVLKELEAVDDSVKQLYSMTENVLAAVNTQVFENQVSNFKKSEEKLVKGLDTLTKGVDGFFKVVLTGRDALLSDLTPTNSTSDGSGVKNKTTGQFVK